MVERAGVEDGVGQVGSGQDQPYPEPTSGDPVPVRPIQSRRERSTPSPLTVSVILRPSTPRPLTVSVTLTAPDRPPLTKSGDHEAPNHLPAATLGEGSASGSSTEEEVCRFQGT